MEQITTGLALTGRGQLAHPPGTPEFEATAVEMAERFEELTGSIRRNLEAAREAGRELEQMFGGQNTTWNTFEVEYRYVGTSYYCHGTLDALMTQMTRRGWQILTAKLGVRDLMSVAKRKQFDEQLEKGEVPDITPEAIVGILMGLAGQARDFAAEAVREVFDLLRPARSAYKTNDVFRVGKRVILSHQVERRYDGRGFRLSYSREQQAVAIDNVFHVLDGRGIVREGRPPLVEAINATGPDGRGETEYFRFRCFKNHNLHLEFKRLDLVKQLNGVAAGEYVLGEDGDHTREADRVHH